jgi:hypothetical protein
VGRLVSFSGRRLAVGDVLTVARNAYERLLAYIEWTSAAVRMLGSQVSNSDLDRLVLTERYRLLLAGLAGTMTSTERPVQRALNGAARPDCAVVRIRALRCPGYQLLYAAQGQAGGP